MITAPRFRAGRLWLEGRAAGAVLKAVETAALPPKTKEAGLQFVEHIRAVAGNTTLTLADQLSLLLDRTGYRAMLRESRAENMEQKLENLGELIDIAGGFHSAREFLDHAALATNRERGGMRTWSV